MTPLPSAQPTSPWAQLLICFFFVCILAGNSVATPAPELPPSGDTSLFIDIKRAQEQRKESAKVLFIDVRGENDFAIAHIEGSLNIPLHHIKTKPFLKDLHLVLVNTGYAITELRREAEELNKTGYTTQILAGGLAFWVQQGGQLSGSQPFANDFHLLSPFTILAEQNVRPAIYVLSDTDTTFEQSSESSAKRFHFRTARSLAEVLQQHRSRLGEFEAIVICSAKQNNLLQAKTIPADFPQTIFFLKDGLQGLKAAEETITAMLKPREQRTKSVEPCSSCPPSE